MPKPEHIEALARAMPRAEWSARRYATDILAAITTDPALQDAVLAALVEGGALHCCCAWCCTGSPREQRGQGHAGCPS